ncbi:GDSL-type esterase/lipase family protein [Puniceicoccus vermicola]|uniref:Right-handed parallel beta-helix repeat-containing protein n=1 Tax=Puniceicoccus vermicola TaxID=388746 RepID=A0A7X1AXK8_9BACT|nr:GDSL-type esterase/lipase family protein [Puniceicoccus vermicola]MBC2601797.1 right-handed parallel beta-helix repeat-containing protein [Puniceicoccus vermicola]
MRSFLKIAAAFFFAFQGAPLSNGADLWVNAPTEIDTNFNSIQEALNEAQAGDTIHVSPGVYQERVSFQNSGTEEAPITLIGSGPGVKIDGSTPIEEPWEPAPDIGPGVFRLPLDFFPFTVTANGQTITTLDEKRTSSENSKIHWKEAFLTGVGRTGWDGVRALAMYRNEQQELLIRFKNNLDPNLMTMTVAPREATIDTNGQDYCVIRNLAVGNSAIGVGIKSSKGVIVENCIIDPADYGILLEEGAEDAILRNNRISLSPYAGADPWRNGAWDNWTAMKAGGFYDRAGIRMNDTNGGHEIHDNYIHDHWDGIEDVGNPPWAPNMPDANPDLHVHHNQINNLNDDGMETMGPSVNGRWHDNLIIRTRCGFRIKAPQTGPVYIYRNLFLDNKEDLRNFGQGEQFYPDVEVWVYHNTSTADTAINRNYHRMAVPLTTPNYHFFNNLFWCRNWTRSSDPLPKPDWKTDANVFILANQEHPRPWDPVRDSSSASAIQKQWLQSLTEAAEADLEANSTWVGHGPSGFRDPESYDLSLTEDSPARNRGIDPSQIRKEPLPGLKEGYFTGSNPDAGALQYGDSMPQIPENNSTVDPAHNPGEILVVLVGDSTVTGKSDDRDQAGWGWALQHWTTPGIRVENTAVGGRSSRSFRSEGRWDKAMAMNPDWVLIQFGHNDQPGKGPERESDPETDYRDHLRRYVREAREQGATPVLVSPVCRRVYHSNGTLSDSLEPYAESVKIVAEEMNVPLLDLHQYSFDQFSKITSKESLQFSPTGTTDRTHFSTAGSALVADWVVELMNEATPELASRFQLPRTLPILNNDLDQ